MSSVLRETARDDGMPAMLALDWLERDPLPRLICSRALVLIWANDAARAALAEGSGLELRDGALATFDRARQSDLCAFIKGCAPAVSSFLLPRPDGDGHLLLTGQRIAPHGAEPGPVGLAILSNGRAFRPLYADLDRAFGLTPAEHRVLLRMIEGQNAEAIADATDISIETVRSHIRNLYTKMGVASREAMFARVAPFRL